MALGSDAAMAVAFFASAASVAWSAAYAWGKWLARPQTAALTSDLEQRLTRLEQAMDAVAVEVERIGEANRFTARILDERLPTGSPALPSRTQREGTITPH